jgi:hypothetical protein
MGKHFDSMIEFAKGLGSAESADPVPSVKGCLESLLRDAVLFEFPLKAEEVFARIGKSPPEYGAYLRDYFDLSEQHGSFFLAPFPLTAIEDDVSVVFMQHQKESEYLLASCRNMDSAESKSTVVYFGHVKMKKPEEKGIWAEVSPYFFGHNLNGVRMPFPSGAMADALCRDIHSDARSYVDQVVYLMDPANFIIRKENKASRKYYDKPAHKRPAHFIPKSVMRPHYICLSEQDTREFLQNSSREPRAAHPVRGHWRTLVSEKWTHKKGQTIFVKQYFTGQGVAEGFNGWTYEVMVKESPKKIVPYSNSGN